MWILGLIQSIWVSGLQNQTSPDYVGQVQLSAPGLKYWHASKLTKPGGFVKTDSQAELLIFWFRRSEVRSIDVISSFLVSGILSSLWVSLYCPSHSLGLLKVYCRFNRILQGRGGKTNKQKPCAPKTCFETQILREEIILKDIFFLHKLSKKCLGAIINWICTLHSTVGAGLR